MKYILIIITLIISILVPNTYADTASEVSKRIEGVADFLIERANENAISMFEEKINRNPLVKEYLPNTSKMLATFDLKILMLSDSLWKYNVEKDINTLTEMLKDDFKKTGMLLLLNDKFKRINELQLEIKNKINNPEEILSKFNVIYRKMEVDIKAINLDQLVDDESLTLSIYFMDDAEKGLSDVINMIKRNSDTIDTINTIESLKEDVSNLKESVEYIQNISSKTLSYTNRVSYMFLAIESLDVFKQKFDRQSNNYKKFKNYSLFFAQLSDAKDASDAKVVLRTFALPAGSYKSKRKDEMRLSISSYLGMTSGWEGQGSYIKAYSPYSGLIAPIGLECSWGNKHKSSFSILGNFFDFGAVVNSQLYNTEEKFKVKDILAPGLAVIWGLPNVPLAVGSGYFKANGIRNNAPNSQRISFFFAFDMPLFALY